MAFSFSELLTPVSVDRWKAGIISVAESLGFNTLNWSEGGFTRNMFAVFTRLYTAAGESVRIIAAGGLLDTASGAWLKLLARNVFEVEPIEATYASAANALVLTNGGGGLYPYQARQIVVANSVTKKTYRNVNAGTLNPGVGQTLTLDLEADEPGSASNASVGEITEMVTTFLGVTCTNPVALFGLDEEPEPQLKQRCRDSRAALSIGGVRRAYEYYAKSAKRTDGSPIGVTRARVLPPPGDGTLTVVVANASGTIAGADVTTIQTLFDETVTPYGFAVTAVSATSLPVSVPCTIWVPASLGLTASDVQTAVFNALKEYVTNLSIGGLIISPATGKIYWRTLLAVAAGAVPGAIDSHLTSEVDIDVASTEAPVWSGILSQTTVVQVS